MEHLTKNRLETRKLGENLAKEVLQDNLEKKGPANSALVLALTGELGGGKTTFLQGFAKGLGIKEKITSPTFVILKRFKIENYKLPTSRGSAEGGKIENFFHIDCYRIEKARELIDLDFKEIISSPQNIVAIEWAEKIKKILPKKTIIIEFEFLSEKERKITINR